MSITVTILIAAALIAGYTDLRARRIPNWLTGGMVVYGLLLHSYRAGWSGFLLSWGGLAVGLGLMLIPYLLRGLGAGDVKFLAAVGSIVGALGVLVVFALATGLGAIMGAIALHRKRTPEEQDQPARTPVSIPYGIALSFGTLLFTGLLIGR
jgi:prepilin peptidase CpaA